MEIKTKKEIINSALSILKANKILTLSTVKGKQPYSCSVYYVFDDKFNLYFWTDLDSDHCENVKLNSKVSVNIADTTQKWGSLLKGLQGFGVCEKLGNKETLKYGKLYMKRYPKVCKLLKNPRELLTKFRETGIYVIRLNKIKILDEKKFGKEEYKEFFV